MLSVLGAQVQKTATFVVYAHYDNVSCFVTHRQSPSLLSLNSFFMLFFRLKKQREPVEHSKLAANTHLQTDQ